MKVCGLDVEDVEEIRFRRVCEYGVPGKFNLLLYVWTVDSDSYGEPLKQLRTGVSVDELVAIVKSIVKKAEGFVEITSFLDTFETVELENFKSLELAIRRVCDSYSTEVRKEFRELLDS